MADDAAPPTDSGVSTPYLVTQHDGSTATYYAHTDRPPTQGEVAQYADSQGQHFAGFPQPAEQAAPSTAPTPEAPSLGSRAYNLLLPHRSFLSQLPSMGGAVGGGMYGAALGAPLGPPGMIVGGLIGAGLGGAGGEAAQYSGEQLLGAAPAEEGTLGQRVTSGGIRGVVGEAFGAPIRALGLIPTAAVRPVAEAAGELAPVLGRATETVAPVAAQGADELTAQVARVIGGGAAPHGAAEQLAAQAAEKAGNPLAEWWAENAAGKSGAEIAKAWASEGAKDQARIAGEHLGNMQTIMGTLERGGVPLQKTFDMLGLGSAGTSLTGYLTGHPYLAGAFGIPAAKEVAANVGNKLVSGLLATPEGMQTLYGLSRGADVAGPWLGGLTRAVAQPAVAGQWPPATVMWPTQPPP